MNYTDDQLKQLLAKMLPETREADAWCELAVTASTSDVILLAKHFERERDQARRELAAATKGLDDLKRDILDLSHPNCQMLLKELDALQKTSLRLMDEKIAAEKERDALKTTLASADREIERLNLMVEMMDESKELAASQQEVERLREAMQSVIDDDKFCQDNYGERRDAWIATLSDALSSNPAPIRTDTERLNLLEKQAVVGRFFDRLNGTWADSHYLKESYPSLRHAIDAEIERTKGAE